MPKEAVKLGEHSYDVVPQKWGYLRTRLGGVFSALAESNTDGVNAADLVGGRAHDVLKVFIPNLMPSYEWHGYPTQEAMDAGDYSDEYDKSPTPDEIVLAFQVVMRANRLDLLGKLKDLVDPQMIRAYVNKAVAEAVDSQTTTSPNSSAAGTDGPSTTSSTTESTESESAD